MENNTAPAKNEAPQDKMTPAKWLLRLLQGAIIGAGAVLPGISGGVLCVVFGIYQPMMELLAHPFRMFKKYYQMFIPILQAFYYWPVCLACCSTQTKLS